MVFLVPCSSARLARLNPARHPPAQRYGQNNFHHQTQYYDARSGATARQQPAPAVRIRLGSDLTRRQQEIKREECKREIGEDVRIQRQMEQALAVLQQ